MINENKLISNFNFREFIFTYAKYTKYIVVSIILSLIICFLVLRHISPNYRIKATVLVKEEKNDFTNKLNDISKIGLDISGNNIKIENEILILKSRNIINLVAKNLNLNIEYYDLNSTINNELFDNIPININFLNGIKSVYNTNKSIEIKKINNSKIKIKDISLNKIYVCSLGKAVKTSLGEIIITPTNNFNKDFNLLVRAIKLENVVDNLTNSINIELADKESSVLELTIDSKNISKGKKILNELIKQHSKETINDKIEVSVNTLSFIKNRIYISSKIFRSTYINWRIIIT